MGGYMNCCHRSFTRRKSESEQGRKRKKKKTKSDIICGQYTNAYKLGANWNKQDFKNYKNWSQQFFIFNFPFFI